VQGLVLSPDAILAAGSEPTGGASGTPARFTVADPNADGSWDSQVSLFPAVSLFHQSGWAAVLRDSYGHRPAYLALRGAKRGRFVAALPVMEVSSWLTGRRGVSLPFSDSCPLLSSDHSADSRLLAETIKFGIERGWRYLEFRGGNPPMPSAAPSLSFREHILALNEDEARQFSQLSESTRRLIRRARNEGLHVGFSRELDALRQFYGLQCKTRRRHGIPPQPWRFFANVHRHVLSRNQGFVALATQHGKPVAGAVFLYAGSTAIYKFAASERGQGAVGASHFLMWEAIRWLIQHGFSSLHLGRSSLAQEGLRRFKLAWGSRERHLHYFRYDLHRNTFLTSVDRAHGWHNHVFRHLPPFLARALGTVAYQHLS
jgi:Acetyltransferase (GNAT) domain